MNVCIRPDLLTDFIPNIGKEQWLLLCDSTWSGGESFGVFCSLISANVVEQVLSRPSWDLMIGNGLPGFVIEWTAGSHSTRYEPTGGYDGIRPLIHWRQFHGTYAEYVELCEEFRLYHNLADDRRGDRLIDFDESGYEVEVVRISNKSVTAQIRYIKQYLAATQLHLAVYIDSVRYSDIPLASVPPEDRTTVVKTPVSYLRRDIFSGARLSRKVETVSRLLGKVLIPPPPMTRAGKWPFNEGARRGDSVHFVIGVVDEGDPVESTSDPDLLSNYFGANPGAPHYLTPVFFRREVLSKYYADSDRYEITDGHLRCFGLWGMRIDNNHPSHIAAFLGDLGRDLPYPERLHWRQFNVPPAGEISEVNYRRSFLAQFVAPEAPDLLFRSEYQRFCEDWERRYCWPLLLALSERDAHLLRTVRTPVTNSQAELDDQVLTLAKLLVDSLNEARIVTDVGSGPEAEKGLAKLERYFTKHAFTESAAVLEYLRSLQALRSAGSGHRKGAAYDRALNRRRRSGRTGG